MRSSRYPMDRAFSIPGETISVSSLITICSVTPISSKITSSSRSLYFLKKNFTMLFLISLLIGRMKEILILVMMLEKMFMNLS